DIDQEAEALVDLLQDARGDFLSLRIQLGVEPGEPLRGGADRKIRRFADMLAVYLHRQRLGLEAKAAAGLAGRARLEALQLLAYPRGVGLLPAPFHVRDDTFER